MEKTFANATVLSATVLAAFMIMVPINHLSAQNEVKMDEKTKMRKVVIQDLDVPQSRFSFEIDGMAIPVTMDASTTVFLGNGDQVQPDVLKNGQNIYVFGEYDAETKTIPATKIVIRNKRITERTSLSRAQLSAQGATNSPLDLLGLSAR